MTNVHNIRPETLDADRVGEQHRGQARMAYRLAEHHHGRLIHVHNVGWHRWDGTRWREDDKGHATRAVLTTLRAALAESLKLPKATANQLRRDVDVCHSATAVAGVPAT